MTAVANDLLPRAPGVGQFPFPTPVASKNLGDFAHWQVAPGMEQLLDALADRFRLRPAVQLGRAGVPALDHAAGIQGDDRVMGEIDQLGLPPQIQLSPGACSERLAQTENHGIDDQADDDKLDETVHVGGLGDHQGIAWFQEEVPYRERTQGGCGQTRPTAQKPRR